MKMTIKEAAECIRQTVRLYLKRDEFGDYRIPVVRQRPVFLLGAPGIGKTAIMEQVAADLQIALVAYSMTHHTRQSALGLPFIVHKNYDGLEADVSEYTMSEIIATIYDIMEKSGKKEGILFLDEINCVSETLSPSMLQFLQYKVFGRHRVPEGWVVVTAGNPPEYNRSVREFDVVTMDRLKLLEVEPDYPAWREYALNKHLHGAILSFLELKKEYFYKIGTTANGRSYVTARGWEDLSEMIGLYEEEGITVEESLIGQYLHDERTVREFAAYYDLYNKYKRNYGIDSILAGNANEQVIERLKKAGFDERLSLLSILMENVVARMDACMDMTDFFSDIIGSLKHAKELPGDELPVYITKQKESHQGIIDSLMSAGAMSEKERDKQKRSVVFFEAAEGILGRGEGFDGIKNHFDAMVKKVKTDTMETGESLKNLFNFVEKAFEDGNEMLLLVTYLTSSKAASAFIGRFGSDEYKKFAGELMVSDTLGDIHEQLKDMDL